MLAGISVEWVRTSVYIITGVLCGLAAFIWLAMNGAVDPATLGRSNEMYAIAAVVIGGISMSGGKGKLLGVLFGAMSYNIIDKIIAAMRFDALINDTIKGAILLVAVLIQIIIPSLRRRLKKAGD
ncbi:MAG: ABC transporter permease, partial [Clostridiales bacterium]|nr:ABC transporter permease [Clostridiales bacterium]